MATTGVLCGCPPAPPPAKRPRGRPRQHVDGCRACWRSLAADRDLPPPHDLSLATRCLHELLFERPGLEEAAVVAALKLALPAAGFAVTDRLPGGDVALAGELTQALGAGPPSLAGGV